MRLATPDDARIVVKIIKAAKDDRKMIDGKANKNLGKMAYETLTSIDVFDATPEAVEKAVRGGLETAAKAAAR